MPNIQTDLFHNEPTLRDIYNAWKEENPEMVMEFFHQADYFAKHGKRFGAKLVWEYTRWRIRICSRGDTYKCNNNWPAFLIRDWIKTNPRYSNLVEIRKQKGEDNDNPNI